VSRGSRARDRQRHRERANSDLADVPTRGLIDELMRRSRISAGYDSQALLAAAVRAQALEDDDLGGKR
jgi:hypothetical protein